MSTQGRRKHVYDARDHQTGQHQTYSRMKGAVLLALASPILALSQVEASDCLNPTWTPSTPITHADFTSDVLCDVSDSDACAGGPCEPKYYYLYWQNFMCHGGLLHGLTWRDGDHGWAFPCIFLGGIPLPRNNFCRAFDVAYCEEIHCGGAGDCPYNEFCSGDGICKETEYCTRNADCGEYVCNGGLCMPWWEATDLPDLTVSELVANPMTGQGRATILNASSVPVSGPFSVILTVDQVVTHPFVLGDLEPGESVDIWRSLHGEAGTLHTLRVSIDVNGDVDEFDELNNEDSISYQMR